MRLLTCNWAAILKNLRISQKMWAWGLADGTPAIRFQGRCRSCDCQWSLPGPKHGCARCRHHRRIARQQNHKDNALETRAAWAPVSTAGSTPNPHRTPQQLPLGQPTRARRHRRRRHRRCQSGGCFPVRPRRLPQDHHTIAGLVRAPSPCDLAPNDRAFPPIPSPTTQDKPLFSLFFVGRAIARLRSGGFFARR